MSDGTLLLVALLAVAGATIAVSAWRAERVRLRFLREAGFVLGAYFAYFAVRGATEGDLAAALRHARWIVGVEQYLGIWIEPTLQTFVLDFEWAVTISNWVYIWGHWPVIGGVAIWLFFRRPDHYPIYRNAFLISGAIGLVMFMAFPAAPPRLAGVGLEDTVVDHSNFYHLLQPPQLTNQYAAFPSLHFGWNMLIGIALIETSRLLVVRAAGVVLPTAMLVAIVLTANHYVIDAVAGAVVALLGLLIARYLHRHPWRHAPPSGPDALPTSGM